jgi:vanillate O-demethylase monooxygenase subunit
MFLRNSWYVAGWSKDLIDQPARIVLLDEPVVLFRGADGQVGALRDHCPHRHAPLSMGQVQGNALQCGYHGVTFDRRGICVKVPSQSEIPTKLCVKAYPVVERFGWIWLWMGDVDAADPKLIPDFGQLTDPNYAAVGKTNHVRSAYRLVTDNLMDLSHAAFVHPTTIGNPQFAENAQMSVNRTDEGLRVQRLVCNVPAPPTYVKSGRLPAGKLIDRWQIIDFIPPCFVRIHVGGAEAGTGAQEGRYEHGLNLWVINAMTPETATTTHYHWASVRCHALGDPMADELFFSQVSEAFEEDKHMLEAQQQELADGEDSWAFALNADAGSIQARRILDRLIAQEASGLAAQ